MKTNENDRIKVVDITTANCGNRTKSGAIFYRPRSIQRPSTANPHRDLWKTLVAMIGLVLLCWAAWELVQ